MSEKSIIIIGAGLAGLSTGCYAQMNGYETRIFEHRSVPGGVAATWERKGYIFDGGIHFVINHKPGTALYEVYRELGITQANRFVDVTSYGHFFDEASGRSVEIAQDLHRLASNLKSFSLADGRVIDRLVAGAQALRGMDMGSFGMSKPPELKGPLDRLKEMWKSRRLLRYFSSKYARSVADYVSIVHDPWLRDFLKNIFLPEVPVWFLFMLLALLANGQIGLLEGGCLDFVMSLERGYKDLGGQVNYKETVEEILVENDQAIGIRLANQREYSADVVISAADGYTTIFKMLGGRYLDRKIKKRYNTWKLVRPLAVINFGVGREFKGEPWMNIIKVLRPFTVGDQSIDLLIVRIFNYSNRFAPPGKTVVQVEFETEWRYWNDLQKENRAVYDAEKKRVAAEVLERLDVHYPGISSLVEVTDVATPYTTWRYTLNQKGAYMGWLPTPGTLMTAIPRTLPGLKNFYMAGQWVMPGGGVPSCLYSGRHAIELLCKRDKKPFSITTA